MKAVELISNLDTNIQQTGEDDIVLPYIGFSSFITW